MRLGHQELAGKLVEKAIESGMDFNFLHKEVGKHFCDLKRYCRLFVEFGNSKIIHINDILCQITVYSGVYIVFKKGICIYIFLNNLCLD